VTAAPAGPDWLQIVAVGSPKPKGSLRHVGHGRMTEQLEGSKPWREAVKWAALEAIAERDGRWFPYAGPVTVDVTITVPKPASAPKTRRTWPVTRRSGDVDKHLRNVLDALTDAAVFGDDSQVIAATVRKVYPEEHAHALGSPGARIFVCPEESA
jgi:Holliday junction resolvase RusA-like endonuclease